MSAASRARWRRTTLSARPSSGPGYRRQPWEPKGPPPRGREAVGESEQIPQGSPPLLDAGTQPVIIHLHVGDRRGLGEAVDEKAPEAGLGEAPEGDFGEQL